MSAEPGCYAVRCREPGNYHRKNYREKKKARANASVAVVMASQLLAVEASGDCEAGEQPAEEQASATAAVGHRQDCGRRQRDSSVTSLSGNRGNHFFGRRKQTGPRDVFEVPYFHGDRPSVKKVFVDRFRRLPTLSANPLRNPELCRTRLAARMRSNGVSAAENVAEGEKDSGLQRFRTQIPIPVCVSCAHTRRGPLKLAGTFLRVM